MEKIKYFLGRCLVWLIIGVLAVLIGTALDYLFPEKTVDLVNVKFPSSSIVSVSDYDALAFPVNGSKIYGQILKPDRNYGNMRPCVIIFHGFAGFGRFDDIGQALCRAGCVVIIPHHRGAWGSEGKYLVTNCIEDATELIKYAQSKEFQIMYHIDPNKIFLIGHSMGGNTVFNAAKQAHVRGIVMLAPCDIGSMVHNKTKEEMNSFLVDNGLEVLHTDGFEAVYEDLTTHADQMAFPTSAKQMENVNIFLATGKLDICIPEEEINAFWDIIGKQKANAIRIRKDYECRHGLMGVRETVTKDIATFINRCIQ